MDRLTRVQIIEAFRAGRADVKTFNALCNMALQSLSQEAVRDEVLEEAAKVCERLACPDVKPPWRAAPGYEYFENAAKAIRALKREPNAAAPEGPAHGLPCWPVDGPAPAAPDVATEATLTAEWLEAFAEGLIHPEGT